MAKVKTTDVETEAFEDFMSRHEEAAQAVGIVLVRVSFPSAEQRVYPGKYSGVVVMDGDKEATYSDGSRHK